MKEGKKTDMDLNSKTVVLSQNSTDEGGHSAQGTTQAQQDPAFAFKASAFLASIAGVSALFGFGATLGIAKKKDPVFFDKGVAMGNTISESGASLAMRALGWGTVYAVGGCSLLFFTIWKIAGCNDLHEFRMKMGDKLPKIRKNDPPQSRTEFEGLRDLMTYLETWGKKEEKTESTSNKMAMNQSSSKSESNIK